MDGKNKLQSIIKQVQSTTTKLGFKDRLSIQSSANSQNQQSSSGTQLDLDSAIEYNRYLINSYLEERNSRELPLYERIVAESKDSEDQIIESIEKEFFLEQQNSQNDNDDNSSIIQSEELQSTNCDNLEDSGDNSDLIQSKILEICVLQKLPEFNPQVPNLFLNYIDLEKKKLQKQVTIVSKRLSDMIVENQQPLSEELNRVNLIDSNVQCAIETCSSGRHSLSYTKRDFTSKSLTIVENYSQRESIIKVIKCLLNIKTIQTTIEHIQNLLEYEKNFPSAIRLYYETCHILEEMAPKYACVEEMRAKLSQMLNMAEEQMNSVLAKLPDRFCRQTYEQLCEAYRQIGKSEKLILQLLEHFKTTIDDKAFSIVHGYVKLFSELSISSTSTPVKSKGKNSDWAGGTQQTPQTTVNESRDFDLKRKPFRELCQYLKPESFLSCLTDLCRAMWDIMQNYHQIVLFYRSEGGRKSNKLSTESEDSAAAIEFAQTKLRQGVLQVWSDIQHKIRTIITSVKFVDSNTAITDDDPSKANETTQNDSFVNSNVNERSFGGVPVHQDQLLFSFEEFIKILTVCEKMIEIGEEFCSLYEEDANGNRNCFDSTLQNTLYQQTRAYFQSYHQVSMAELRIFLENETWTRCPIESHNEFQLIANLQEFSFIKHRLLKLNRNFNEESNEKSTASTTTTATATAASSVETIVTPRQQLARSSSSSYLLSPTSAKTKHYFFTNNNKTNTEIEEEGEDAEDTDSNVDNCLFNQIQSPFDDIFVLLTDTKVRYDSDSSDNKPEEEEDEDEDFEMILKQQQRETNLGTEIVTTNTALNVIRLIGRYMHIMYLLRPISHDIIKALLELFDYYFFTVYRFFAIDPLNAAWLTPFLTSMLHHQSGSIELNVSSSSSSPSPSTMSQTLPVPSVQTPSSSNTPILNHLSTELRSFIRRINETLIINPESQSQSTGLSPTTTTTTSSHNNQSFNKSSSDSALMALHLASSSSPGSSPKRIVKHPCPMLPSYVAINEPNNLWALGERIMAIQSLIFISRQFYNLCPFLLDFLRKEESINESTLSAATPTAGAASASSTSNDTKEKIHHKKSVEDGFKMLQFYHDQMCLNVESLLYQCLLAVSTKLLPYDSIIASMCQIKWDLKEIPSIHSNYVDCFVESIRKFNDQYLQLLKNCDLEFLLPINHNTSNRSMTNECQNTSEPVVIVDEDESEDLIPLSKLDLLSKKLNQLLWECIVRISNRSFVEGFSTAKKCTNEGRALMQLDYQQFLSHIEKIMSPYFGLAPGTGSGAGTASGVRAAKALLSTEKEFVEEYVKAYYLTDAIFIDWIRQRPDYTTKQIVSLIHCLTHDNRKQRSFLLAAVDTSSIELPIAAPSSIS